MGNNSLVLLERFYDPQAAYVVRGLLHSHGVESYVFDDYFNSTAWHLRLAIGWTRVMVHEDTLEKAIEILKTNTNEQEQTPAPFNIMRFLTSLMLTIFSGAPTPLKKRKK